MLSFLANEANNLQAYGQVSVAGRTWVWLQHWMPMPQAGEALPFDGSLAWTFVSGERDQFSTVAFYVMHLRGAPDDELAQHVQRAIPVFAETLTRLRLEQTGPPSPAGRIENRGPTQQSQVAGGVTVSRPGCESLLDESLGLGTDD